LVKELILQVLIFTNTLTRPKLPLLTSKAWGWTHSTNIDREHQLPNFTSSYSMLLFNGNLISSHTWSMNFKIKQLCGVNSHSWSRIFTAWPRISQQRQKRMSTWREDVNRGWHVQRYNAKMTVYPRKSSQVWRNGILRKSSLTQKVPITSPS